MKERARILTIINQRMNERQRCLTLIYLVTGVDVEDEKMKSSLTSTGTVATVGVSVDIVLESLRDTRCEPQGENHFVHFLVHANGRFMEVFSFCCPLRCVLT